MAASTNPYVRLNQRQPEGWSLAIVLITSLALLLLQGQGARPNNNVDLVLVLAMDVSSSVDHREFDLQKHGMALAFRHPLVAKAISEGHHKRIAVATVQWAGYTEQRIVLPWRVIGSAAEAIAYAKRLETMGRAYPDGATHIKGIIQFGSEMALSAPFSALRRVIDISGDGVDNVSGPPPAAARTAAVRAARTAAVRAGVTINGLAIANEVPDLTSYYRDAVIGGPSAFVLTARNYDDYPRAILRKLIREIETRLII